MYREQEYIERCHCETPVSGPCECCGRLRCAYHLERGLCMRCNQALTRELDARSTQRFTISAVLGTAVTFGTMVAHLTFGIAIGLPLSVAAFFGLRRRQRRRLIVRMGPSLSAMKGELPQPERPIDFDPPSSTPPPGSGSI